MTLISPEKYFNQFPVVDIKVISNYLLNQIILWWIFLHKSWMPKIIPRRRIHQTLDHYRIFFVLILPFWYTMMVIQCFLNPYWIKSLNCICLFSICIPLFEYLFFQPIFVIVHLCPKHRGSWTLQDCYSSKNLTFGVWISIDQQIFTESL